MADDPISILISLNGRHEGQLVTKPDGNAQYSPSSTTKFDPNASGGDIIADVVGVFQKLSAEGLAAGGTAEFIISATAMPAGLTRMKSKLVLPDVEPYTVKGFRERWYRGAINGYSLWLAR